MPAVIPLETAAHDIGMLDFERELACTNYGMQLRSCVPFNGLSSLPWSWPITMTVCILLMLAISKRKTAPSGGKAKPMRATPFGSLPCTPNFPQCISAN